MREHLLKTSTFGVSGVGVIGVYTPNAFSVSIFLVVNHCVRFVSGASCSCGVFMKLLMCGKLCPLCSWLYCIFRLLSSCVMYIAANFLGFLHADVAECMNVCLWCVC